MCNAHNHPPGCNCGWGGYSYNSYTPSYNSSNPYREYKKTESYTDWIHYFDHTFESYVKPNSRCPVCGDSVFFYQSPYGGRVFFDELGPPWPKHPCTDRNSVPEKPVEIETFTTFKWQEDGWGPLFIENIEAKVAGLALHFAEIHGMSNDVKYKLIVIDNQFYEKVSDNFESILCHIRVANKDEVELSFLDCEDNEYKARGFHKLSIAKREYERGNFEPKAQSDENNSKILQAFKRAKKPQA